MNFASIARVSMLLYAVAATLAQGQPSNKTIDLSTTTQNSSVDRIYGGSVADASK
ncbi:hypothetical protein V7S43_010738 [Phytophthora oleae]|uniref:RxLR effector protein n=1 Tax=Phytophthora oleae TaxID=2107226 RepID=A0ABD3FES8_9STRA